MGFRLRPNLCWSPFFPHAELGEGRAAYWNESFPEIPSWFAIILLGVVERLCVVGNTFVMERDWVNSIILGLVQVLAMLKEENRFRRW
jgi:hypothetical protein